VRPTLRELRASARPGDEIEVAGWVRTARHGKERSFLDLVDGSDLAGLQLVAEPGLANYESVVRHIGTGTAIEARGELRVSPGGKQAQELGVRSLEVLGPAGDDYPLQKKRHGFEFLRTIGHLRLRTNTLGAVMRVRSAAALRTRKTAPKVLVRGRRCAMVRRYSKPWRFFWSG